jgi:hypothetical protein
MQKAQHGQQTMSPKYNHPVSDNLDTLSTLHLVKGLLTYFFSLFFIFYAFMGGVIGQISMEQNTELPFDFSIIFYVVGSIGFLICMILGTLNLMSYSFLKKRKNHGFIFAISIINCLMGVLGIILGIFTIIEINKPHIKDQFMDQ